jgi:DNA-binding response OmpR family regulator
MYDSYEQSKHDNKSRILIIDEDEDINNLFKICLEDYGYRMHSYTNPIDALSYFKKDGYDLILLDLKMPQIDGVAMFNALKNRDDKVIICMITADLYYLVSCCATH